MIKGEERVFLVINMGVSRFRKVGVCDLGVFHHFQSCSQVFCDFLDFCCQTVFGYDEGSPSETFSVRAFLGKVS
jgi:hypothetical protein